jgi:two-component system cell cycle sensor histidine kinase/response regulator CckA
MEGATMSNERHKTVLVIDDDKTLRDLMEAMLQRMGHKVLVAENGKSAIKAAESYDDKIDLAILDLFLPDIRGDKVCPTIMETHPDLKIILMSGYSLEDLEVLKTDVHGFIQKPCSYENLSETLENIFT